MVPILLLLLFIAFVAVSMPLSLFFRYRAGSARRRAYGWVEMISLAASAISVALLLLTAAISNAWIPHAFAYTIAGMATGCLLGVVGLWATHWEPTPRGLHYTPSRLLILAITLLVAARIAFGFWRGWHAWRSPGDQSWLVASGAAGSMGAGGVILAYYLIYWLGARRRIKIERARARRSR